METFYELANEYCGQGFVCQDDDPPTYKEAIYTEVIGGTTYTEGVPCKV